MLNEKQQEAVDYLEGPLLVLAGPGTGKTQLLSQKVAKILEATDLSPDNILCLTFTDSGCQNMRDRLKSIIGKAAAKVHIKTYHSFGADILAEYKLYSESYLRNLDTPIDEVTAFKIIKTLRDALPATDILRGDNVKDIIATISSAKSANLTALDLDKIADQNISDSEVLSENISPLLKKVVPRKYRESLDAAYLPILALLENHDEIPPILKTIDRNMKTFAETFKDALDEAEQTNKITPLSDWKNAFFEKDENDNYRLKDRIANKKLKSIAVIMSQYESYLKAHGLFDFDDMIKEAANALRDDRGFQLSLSERYQYILLDEFQDTNPSQFEIVKLLTDYEKPFIMAVGDDDQAIYEFQGASATNLKIFQEHYGAKVINLTENYRSTQEILDYAHNVIVQADNRFGDKILNSNRKKPILSQISRHEFIASDQEYAFVAKKIASLLRAGVSASEIAVIAPKHKYLLPLLPFLKAEKIDIAYDKRDNLLEDPKISELITLSRFVVETAAEKYPTVSLFEIFSFPFWNLNSLKVINALSAAKNDKKNPLVYLSNSEDEEIKTVAKFLADLAARSFTDPFEIMLDYLLGTAELNGFCSPFLRYYEANEKNSLLDLYENLASLRAKLNSHFPGQKVKLADFIEMVDDYETAEMQLSSTSPYRDAENSVQILSAHKAKGLEFDHVFIIAADHSAWGKGKGNNNLLSLPKNLLQIRHTGATEGERIRLLYVAITRAKTHLTITSSLSNFAQKPADRLEYLSDEPISHSDKLSPELQAASLKTWLQTYLPENPDVLSIYKDRVKSLRFSASSLTSFIDIIYAGPTEFFKRQILRAPAEPASDAIVFGDLIHKTFEKITNSHISDEEALEFFLTELEKAEITPETLADLREKGPLALTISLNAFSDIIRAKNARAEVDLRAENLSFEGVPLTGKIDHININKPARTIEIYDFKTGSYHKEGWDKKPSLYKYSLQLEFYKLLLNLSPTYKNYTVTAAHILFVTPDRDDEVHKKTYEFTPESSAAFRELLLAVYRQISTLDFLNNPEIFIPPDQTRTMKELKAFIELLLSAPASARS